MIVVFSARGWDDYLWWQQQDRKLVKRINLLIRDIGRNGNEGIGKPEALKHDFAGYWSRRITDEHRLVYKIVGDELRIRQRRTQLLQPRRRRARVGHAHARALARTPARHRQPGFAEAEDQDVFAGEVHDALLRPSGSSASTSRTAPA